MNYGMSGDANFGLGDGMGSIFTTAFKAIKTTVKSNVAKIVPTLKTQIKAGAKKIITAGVKSYVYGKQVAVVQPVQPVGRQDIMMSPEMPLTAPSENFKQTLPSPTSVGEGFIKYAPQIAVVAGVLVLASIIARRR